jgi:fluoroquinolone transport system permease protein
MFVKQMFRDSMLAAVCLGAVLSAFLIRYGAPAAEGILSRILQKPSVLSGYYLLLDLFLALLTPYLLCFASAMMMLTEYDENLSDYLAVTPVGKRGYLISRLLFPSALAFCVSVLFVAKLSLTRWEPYFILTVCFLCSLMSVVVALLLFSFSHNRVEGMALGKLSGLLMLGLFVPFFLRSGWQYLFAPLPSFWAAKLCIERNLLFLPPALVSSLAWIGLLYRKMDRKLGR